MRLWLLRSSSAQSSFLRGYVEKTTRTDLRCTASTWVLRVFRRGSQEQEAYSSTGLTSCLYALIRSWEDWGGIVLFKNPRVVDDVVVIMSMWVCHFGYSVCVFLGTWWPWREDLTLDVACRRRAAGIWLFCDWIGCIYVSFASLRLCCQYIPKCKTCYFCWNSFYSPHCDNFQGHPANRKEWNDLHGLSAMRSLTACYCV